jgi:hypothetical protein
MPPEFEPSKTTPRSQECLQISPDEREAFVQKKARQLDKEASIEILQAPE